MVDQLLAVVSQHRSATFPTAVHEGLLRMSTVLAGFQRQVTTLEDERRNLRALAGIGQVVNSSLELDVVLRIVMDTIVHLTGAERGFLMLENEQGKLAMRVARNWGQELIDPSDFALSRTILNQVAEQGEPILTTNAQQDPRFGRQHSIVAYNLRSILCVPLKVKDELIGLIYADNRIRAGIFTQNELDLLVAFANQAAVAIENARLFASVSNALAEATKLKNLLDNVFASIPSGVITTDAQDRVMLCNQAAEAIFNYPAGSLAGQTLETAAPLLAPHLSLQVEQVLHNDRPVIGLEINPTLPGRGQVDLRFSLSPFKDADRATQGVTIVVDDLTEKRHLEARQRLFERMVSPAVIDQLDPNSLSLGGKRAEITVLFADIRGFTSFSEKVSPEQLVSVLNQHLAVAADAVLGQVGTIDKFMGDAIMAWFNAPVPQPDHILRGICAGLAIQEAIEALHCKLPPELCLSFGVGIHCGEAVLGLVGTETRLEYTAIGDCVNIAKRLQESAAPGEVILSAETYQKVADRVTVRPVEPIQAKGKREPLQAYQVLSIQA